MANEFTVIGIIWRILNPKPKYFNVNDNSIFLEMNDIKYII